ncbi:hypothetical protein M404DRAFT_540033 [Pisolithus tinctorius Marx 270]|uniref:Uncharacterized protein n=1 Tax=Pisolithus tinctorius Marx 270 TaxID=870435 RepID=A0A0C3PA70_PISTI|nr:hypothetical protein M404DRAFT_540033 [Pisolithus tinctorius Marx 270]
MPKIRPKTVTPPSYLRLDSCKVVRTPGQPTDLSAGARGHWLPCYHHVSSEQRWIVSISISQRSVDAYQKLPADQSTHVALIFTSLEWKHWARAPLLHPGSSPDRTMVAPTKYTSTSMPCTSCCGYDFPDLSVDTRTRSFRMESHGLLQLPRYQNLCDERGWHSW